MLKDICPEALELAAMAFRIFKKVKPLRQSPSARDGRAHDRVRGVLVARIARNRQDFSGMRSRSAKIRAR